MNRVPRGPYGEAELRALLDRGLIRVTDLAYIPSGDKDIREWRFLWQFPEFDRRKPKDEPTKKAEPVGEAPKPPPRRAMDAQEIRNEIVKRLPKDLMDLSSEELLRHAARAPKIPIPPRRTENAPKVIERPENLPTPTNYLRRLWLPAGVLAMLVFALVPKRSRVPASPVAEPVPEVPALEEIPAERNPFSAAPAAPPASGFSRPAPASSNDPPPPPPAVDPTREPDRQETSPADVSEAEKSAERGRLEINENEAERPPEE